MRSEPNSLDSRDCLTPNFRVRGALVTSIFLSALCIMLVLLLTLPGVLRKRQVLARLRAEPPVMLWVWERPTDLSDIDPRSTGAAVLISTLTLRGSEILNRGRLQPFAIPDSAYRLAVIRIELDEIEPPVLSVVQRDALAGRILQAFGKVKANGLQIDFDAKLRERDFYRGLLEVLRARLQPALPLSMTALSSWCLDDVWIRNLPVDEVVPMFFSMGAGAKEGKQRLIAGRISSIPQRLSMGFSVAESALFERASKVSKSVFLFSSEGWGNSSSRSAIRRLKRRMKSQL